MHIHPNRVKNGPIGLAGDASGRRWAASPDRSACSGAANLQRPAVQQVLLSGRVGDLLGPARRYTAARHASRPAEVAPNRRQVTVAGTGEALGRTGDHFVEPLGDDGVTTGIGRDAALGGRSAVPSAARFGGV